MLAHLGGTFLSFLVPLVIFLIYKDRAPFVRRHSAAALNFQITLAIAYIVLAISPWIGLLVIPFLWLASLGRAHDPRRRSPPATGASTSTR